MDTEAQYRADLQAFLTQRVIPQVAQWEREQTFPRAIVHELGQQGFFRTCLQLQGARGLEAESPLLRLLNEFRVFGIAGGSTETALDIIAEQWAQHAMQLSMSQPDLLVAS